MHVATPDLQRLADRVQARRLQLNLSARRAANLAGMSKDTWARVETGQSVQAATYDKVEDTLGWTVGSCRKILDGGEPISLDSALGGDFQIVPVPSEQLEESVRRVVQDAMVAGTDLTGSKIREVNEHVIAMLREQGILPPRTDQQDQ